MPEQTGLSHHQLPLLLEWATPVQMKPEKPEEPYIVIIPRAMIKQKSVIKPMSEKCAWELGCPICKEEDDVKQKKLHHLLQNNQHPKSYNVPDHYEENIILKRSGKRRWKD